MSDETAELWRDITKAGQEKRRKNRKYALKLLRDFGIKFEEKNFGAHLVITKGIWKCDFWPGTGRWKFRDGGYGFGINRLIRELESINES